MKKRRLGKILLIIVLLLAVTIVGAYLLMNRNLGKLADATIVNVDMGKVTDGEYFGKYTVLLVNVKVKVIVKDHLIENVLLLRHDNGQGKTSERIVEDVIAQQRTNVDIIAGATYSSKVILKAIENAMQ
ncbi:MAG: FMN-binding protein [Candidatus Shapirobacteria bacterium]|jgi:uncharacterized protein with FMN-binding domain